MERSVTYADIGVFVRAARHNHAAHWADGGLGIARGIGALVRGKRIVVIAEG